MKTVLLIDDDAPLRSVIGEVLRATGWRVIEAEDWDTGLKLALEHRPEIVVCDLLMPRCNGYQFCRALHERRAELPRTKIVACSGSGYAIDRMTALEAGADEFVAKPIRPEEFLALLDRLSRGAIDKANEPVETGTRPETFVSFAEGETLVRFWGVRGSIPSPGPQTVYYGGNTSCIEVRADGELIILDAGTGIRGLGQSLREEFGEKPLALTLLISHTHWDHIQGFPFFAPAYEPRNRIRVCAFEGPRKGLEATLSIQMETPYFPVSMREMPGHIEFEELKSLDFEIGRVGVKAAFMNHPGVCVGYRLETEAGSVVYLPDNELFGRLATGDAEKEKADFARRQDSKLREFVAGAEVLIADAQYSMEDYAQHRGWGHSCAEDVVDLAIQADVKQLFLFHHDPDRADEHVARILAQARGRVAAAGARLKVEAAREGAEVRLKKGN